MQGYIRGVEFRELSAGPCGDVRAVCIDGDPSLVVDQQDILPADTLDAGNGAVRNGLDIIFWVARIPCNWGQTYVWTCSMETGLRAERRGLTRQRCCF